MHRQEAAGRLVDVHDAVCADSVRARQPAQLDEQPVRVGVLLLRAVELFHALGGLLAAQVHAAHGLSDPHLAGTDVASLCVEPFAHQVPDRHRAETQDVGHSMCSLSRDSKVFLPSGAARGALRFQRYGMFPLIPFNNPGHSWTSHKAPLHAPSPSCPPQAQHAEEPVAHDGIGVNFVAFCRAAAGLLFNECSGWGGWGGRGGTRALTKAISSCVRGRATVSPGRHQPDRCERTTMRELMVVAAASWGVWRTAAV